MSDVDELIDHLNDVMAATQRRHSAFPGEIESHEDNGEGYCVSCGGSMPCPTKEEETALAALHVFLRAHP
jgi:hypothetical protein